MADHSHSDSIISFKQRDEIDLMQIALLLWGYKLWVCICTSIIVAMGFAYAYFTTPTFYSYAIIAPKESSKGSDASRLFSQLGGMGGMVASQLGMGNTNLDKIEIILKGHDLAEAVILGHNLMPLLFQDMWDERRNKWKTKDSLELPGIRDGVKILRENIIVVRVDAKKNILIIGANMNDPVSARNMVDHYLNELNMRIRANAITDAEANRDYLEKQLSHTSDPILMDKLQNMIAFEIEKAMLIGNQSFEILERPVVPMERSKPKRKFIVLLALLIGAAISALGVFVHARFKSIKTAIEKERD
jgi:capsular polysaccharide biosynthesis protein